MALITPKKLPKPNQKQNLGKIGEDLAKFHLQNKRFKFIASNFHTRFGEIDLIFLDNNQIVFVEVKTRSSQKMGYPEEAISQRKLYNLQKAAEIYLLKNLQFQELQARIDIIAIEFTNQQKYNLRHYKGIN